MSPASGAGRPVGHAAAATAAAPAPAAPVGEGAPATGAVAAPAPATRPDTTTAPAESRPQRSTASALRMLATWSMLACALTGAAGYVVVGSDAGRQAAVATQQQQRLTQLADRTGRLQTSASAITADRTQATATETSFDAALHTASREVAAAAAAQPQDADELAGVNASLVRYATTIERARMAAGAGRSPDALLSTAKSTLDSGVNAPLSRLATENGARADAARGALTGSRVVLGVATFASLATLLAGGWWLARKTHRVVNGPLAGAALLTAGVASVAASTLPAGGGTGGLAVLAATPFAGPLLLLGGLGAGALAWAGVGQRLKEYR